MPFYTKKEVEKIIKQFTSIEKDIWISLSENIHYRFRYNGHIIGACFIELKMYGKRLVFSGDVGRSEDVLLNSPKKPAWVDFLFVESTYGNKLHTQGNVEKKLIELITKRYIIEGP